MPTSYSWRVLRQSDSVETVLGKEEYKSEQLSSRLAYQVLTEDDYGRVECQAENNAVGDNKPCTFIVAQPIRLELSHFHKSGLLYEMSGVDIK